MVIRNVLQPDRRHWRRLTTFAIASIAAMTAPAAAADEVLQLPNLKPLAPYDIHVYWADEATSFQEGQPRAIRFSVSSVNVGAYALEMHGEFAGAPWLGVGATDRAARQCIWWVSRVCVKDREVGRFIWHDAHAHWHFEDYAVYELRRLQNGLPDMTPGGLVRPGVKASFCLMDIWKAEEESAGHDPLASIGTYRRCDDHIQGISPSWADEYGFQLAGQQVPLAGISDGDYALMVRINPLGAILETSLDDNTSYTPIRVIGESVTCLGDQADLCANPFAF